MHQTLRAALDAFLPCAVVSFLLLVGSPHAARAISVNVGFDGGATVDPGLDGALVSSLEQGGTITVDLYLDLASGEVASIFQADFTFEVVGDWLVTLDLGEVSPGMVPFGVGTWPNATGFNAGTHVSLSHFSTNAGGERLLAQLIVTRNSAGAADTFKTFLTPDVGKIFVAKDVPAGVEILPLSTAPGELLVRVPEPDGDLLSGASLVALMMLSRAWGRRVRRAQARVARGRPRGKLFRRGSEAMPPVLGNAGFSLSLPQLQSSPFPKCHPIGEWRN